jgi:hypothetical protein
MIRSKNHKLFEKMSEGVVDRAFDFEAWVNNPHNIMWEEDGSIGLATFEYPGMYSCHWFFKVRGKEAHDLARKMLDDLFSNEAKIVRGLTSMEPKYRAVRLAARRLGMKSYGVINCPEGDHELLCMTKEEFYE